MHKGELTSANSYCSAAVKGELTDGSPPASGSGIALPMQRAALSLLPPPRWYPLDLPLTSPLGQAPATAPQSAGVVVIGMVVIGVVVIGV